jgi:hypothetical protein
MASQRQIQYKQESTKEDSLGIKDAQQVENHKVEAKPKKSAKSPKSADPDPADDDEPAQKLELLYLSKYIYPKIALLSGELFPNC